MLILRAAHLVERRHLLSVSRLRAAIVDVAGRFAIGGEQAHRRHHRLALAGTGFADDRQPSRRH